MSIVQNVYTTTQRIGGMLEGAQVQKSTPKIQKAVCTALSPEQEARKEIKSRISK